MENDNQSDHNTISKEKKTKGVRYEPYQLKDSSFQKPPLDKKDISSDPMIQKSLTKNINTILPSDNVEFPMYESTDESLMESIVSNPNNSFEIPSSINEEFRLENNLKGILDNSIQNEGGKENVASDRNTSQNKRSLEKHENGSTLHKIPKIIKTEMMLIPYNKKECVERYRDWERLQVRRRDYVELFKGKNPLLVVTDQKNVISLKNNYVESKLPIQKEEKKDVIKNFLNTQVLKCMMGPFPIEDKNKAPLPVDWKLGIEYQTKFIAEKNAMLDANK